MRILLDNTMVHRIGAVLDGGLQQSIRAIDALAVFHLAEHILFSDGLLVSNFEKSGTIEYTAKVLEALQGLGFIDSPSSRGVSYSIAQLTSEQYRQAVDDACSPVLVSLSTLQKSDLTSLGSFADEASRPRDIPVPKINHWLRKHDDDYRRGESPTSGSFPEGGGEGTFGLMLAHSRPLRQRLRCLVGANREFSLGQEAALSTIMRIHINEEIARRNGAIYSPSPQRVRISAKANLIFRHRLAEMITTICAEHRSVPLAQLLSCVDGMHHVPLPLFALHALRKENPSNPMEVLEAARVRRDDCGVRRIREWLGHWETRLSSTDPSERMSALSELESRRMELERDLALGAPSVFSSLPLGSIDLDATSGSVSWSPPGHAISHLRDFFRSHFNRRRVFLAAVGTTLLADDRLAARVLSHLGNLIRIR